jgi:hypothetical protein
MKKIKAVEIVLFVCLLVACFMVPRFVTSQLLSGITTYRQTQNQKMVSDLMRKYSLDRKPYINKYPAFPEGGWFEQVIRLGLIGLTVFYAFRVAKRIDRESL